MIEAQNWNFLTYILLVLLARFQLGNQSAPAWLSSETSQLGLVRAGKFQLQPITRLGAIFILRKGVLSLF